MFRLISLFAVMLGVLPVLDRLKPKDTTPALVKSINAYRAQHGLPPMIHSPELTKAAERHASDMARYNRLDHMGTDGSSFSHRARAAGFPMLGGGEIIAGGSADEAVRMWAQSPGHNAQMLGRCRYVGAAGVGQYSCAVFGDR